MHDLEHAATEGQALGTAMNTLPAWVEIDLDALVHNVGVLRPLIGDSRILLIVKADAYGHGAERTARVLYEEGIRWLPSVRSPRGSNCAN